MFSLFKFSFKNVSSLPFVSSRCRRHVHLLLVLLAQPSFFVTLACVAYSRLASATFSDPDLGAAFIFCSISFSSSLCFKTVSRGFDLFCARLPLCSRSDVCGV